MTSTQNKAPRTAVVIGGGFGGIATALRLRKLGFHVTLFDRMARLGGRAQVYVRDGFRYDAGPTIVLAPFLFQELFQLYSKSFSDYVTLLPLAPFYHYYLSDGSTFEYTGNPEDNLREIAKRNPDDCRGFLRILKSSEEVYNRFFLESTETPFSTWKWMQRYIQLKGYKTMSSWIGQHIKTKELREALSLKPWLAGSNGGEASSLSSFHFHLEKKFGVHFPKGGTAGLIDGLQRLMEENGITICLNTTVNKIVTARNKATGVELNNGTFHPADVVIANSDPAFVYKHLLPTHLRGKWNDAAIDSMQYSNGSFVLYFGTNKQYPDVAHHTVLMKEQNIYLHRPTATDPSFAPKNCDSFYASMQVPNLQSSLDWHHQGQHLRHFLIETLGKTVLPGLKEHLVQDFYMTPKDYQNNYLTHNGSAFGVNVGSLKRFPHHCQRVPNLYFVGGCTHPGPSLPAVLSSAKIVEKLIVG